MNSLARRIAADVVAAAERYPAVRSCRSFSALHDVYDANESIIAACGGEVHPSDQAWTDQVNEAVDAVDAVLVTQGFQGLTTGWIEVEGTTYCPFCASVRRVAHYANNTYTPWTPLTVAESANSGCVDDDGSPLPVCCDTCGTEYGR